MTIFLLLTACDTASIALDKPADADSVERVEADTATGADDTALDTTDDTAEAPSACPAFFDLPAVVEVSYTSGEVNWTSLDLYGCGEIVDWSCANGETTYDVSMLDVERPVHARFRVLSPGGGACTFTLDDGSTYMIGLVVARE